MENLSNDCSIRVFHTGKIIEFPIVQRVQEILVIHFQQIYCIHYMNFSCTFPLRQDILSRPELNCGQGHVINTHIVLKKFSYQPNTCIMFSVTCPVTQNILTICTFVFDIPYSSIIFILQLTAGSSGHFLVLIMDCSICGSHALDVLCTSISIGS